MSRSLFVFRRDLRLTDNTALLEASRNSAQVLPVFIFDPTILARYAGHQHRLDFLWSCLLDLEHAVSAAGGSLRFFTGDPATVVGSLVAEEDISSVYVNEDYTPFSRRRDQALAAACVARGARFHALPDQLLNEPGRVRKHDGTPYRVFTPYHRAAARIRVPPPDQTTPDNFGQLHRGNRLDQVKRPVTDVAVEVAAGRAGAVAALTGLGRLADYAVTRDQPAAQGTTGLSPHLRFGTCSVREAWHAIAGQLGAGHPLLRQLYWRDFFTHIGVHFPHVFRHAFRRQYDHIPWEHDEQGFEAWCNGRTGFPIVDAGMRELTGTGLMHNRVRMVTASFLVKNLQIDWRRGEAFFSRYLIDLDPAVNNGNWQWAASTGCDAQPYFRVFNPWRQQARFDPDATYIKRWLPELAHMPARQIHALQKNPAGYLPQIVDLKSSAEIIKSKFRAAS